MFLKPPCIELELIRNDFDKDSLKYAGIDQVGKGEVLGSLIVVCASTSLKLPVIKDSKSFSGKDLNLVEKLIESRELSYSYVKITPDLLDKYNVNDLILLAQKSLLKNFSGLKASVDCHLKCSQKHLEILKESNSKIDYEVAHKLDEKNSLVAAASLIGRKLRTLELEELCKKVGQKVGSGNVMDPLTKSYLLKGFKEGVRLSWSLKSLGLPNRYFSKLRI